MTRQNYKRRAGALRKLLKQLTPRPGNTGAGNTMVRVIEYNFGAVFDTRNDLWRVYNYNSNNCIATVKFSGTRTAMTAVIRYRQRSFYSGVLKVASLSFTGTVIAVPSTHLGDRGRWLREQIRGRVQREYRRSLSLESPRNAVPLSQMVNEEASGLWRDSHGRLRNRRGRYASPHNPNRQESMAERLYRRMYGSATIPFQAVSVRPTVDMAATSSVTDDDIRRAQEILNRSTRQRLEQTSPLHISPNDHYVMRTFYEEPSIWTTEVEQNDV